jgi:hypothetical protein
LCMRGHMVRWRTEAGGMPAYWTGALAGTLKLLKEIITTLHLDAELGAAAAAEHHAVLISV